MGILAYLDSLTTCTSDRVMAIVPCLDELITACIPYMQSISIHVFTDSFQYFKYNLTPDLNFCVLLLKLNCALTLALAKALALALAASLALLPSA